MRLMGQPSNTWPMSLCLRTHSSTQTGKHSPCMLCLVPPSYLNPRIPHQDIPDPPKPPPERHVSTCPRAHSPSRPMYARVELRSCDPRVCPHHRCVASGT